MNKKIILMSSMSAIVLVGCQSGAGSASSSTPNTTSTAPTQTSSYAEFLQRVDPQTGTVLKTAQQALASGLSSDNSPVALGSSYYSDNGFVSAGNTCIANLSDMLVDYGNTTASLNYSKNMSSSQLQNKLGISGSINGDIGKFKGNIEGSYLNETSSDETSISYNFLAILNSTATLKNTGANNERANGMDDHIKQLKANTQDEATNFYNACGNKYVSQVPAGAYVSTTVKLVFKSAADKTQFDAAMSASIESIGSISAAVDAYNSKTGKSEDVNVYALQVGGLPENLFTVFANEGGKSEDADAYHSYNLLTCGISNMDACTNLIADVIRYTGDDFKKQITGTNGKYTNLAQFGDPIQKTNYDNIVGYSNATSALAKVPHGNGSSAYAAQTIIEMLNKDQAMLTYVNDYLAAPSLGSELSSQLYAIQQVYSKRLKYYGSFSNTIVDSCFSGDATLDSNTSCEKLATTIAANRSSGGVYQLTNAQSSLLQYLDATGFISGGTSVSKSTNALIYPSGTSSKSTEFVLSPMLGLNLLLDGFDPSIKVTTTNNQLTFSGQLSNANKKIEITTPVGCPKSGSLYNCTGVVFDFSGFTDEEKTKYTESLNLVFNNKWYTGKNYYLNTNRNYQ